VDVGHTVIPPARSPGRERDVPVWLRHRSQNKDNTWVQRGVIVTLIAGSTTRCVSR
jgi:hypothetical protein